MSAEFCVYVVVILTTVKHLCKFLYDLYLVHITVIVYMTFDLVDRIVMIYMISIVVD